MPKKDTSRIFDIAAPEEFERMALGIFRFQARYCPPYRSYLRLQEVEPDRIRRVADIPFLPVGLFKSGRVYSSPRDPEAVFRSSATSGLTPAQHFVCSLSVFEESFTRGFERFYGPADRTALFALLPGYMERKDSSLIYMVNSLIARGGGGFYMHRHEQLLADLAAWNGRKILLGVSHALLDLAEKHPGPLRDVTVMETGGMKGRREEMPRGELHARLCRAFAVDRIHSEYGMAELMSQAYSPGEGVFHAPPWMRVLIRDPNDPQGRMPAGESGGINIIDLANVCSCSFIQTDDMGSLREDGSFRISGRIAGSDIRGCNLLFDDRP